VPDVPRCDGDEDDGGKVGGRGELGVADSA